LKKAGIGATLAYEAKFINKKSISLTRYAEKVNSRSDSNEILVKNSIKEKVHDFFDSLKSKTTQLSAKPKALMASVFSLSFISSISTVSAFTGTAATLSTFIPAVGWIVAGVVIGTYGMIKWGSRRSTIDPTGNIEIKSIKDALESFRGILKLDVSSDNNYAVDIAEFFDVKVKSFLKEDISNLNDFLRRMVYGLHKQELRGLDREISSELFKTIVKLAETKKCEFISNPNPLQELLRVARWYYSDTISDGKYLADNDFAKVLGIKESALNKYLSGKVKMIYSENNIFNIKQGISKIISKVGDNNLRENLISFLKRFNEYNIREVHKVEYHKDFFREDYRKAIDTILILQTLGSELDSLRSIDENAFIKFKRKDARGYSRLLHHLFQNDKLSIDPGRLAHSTYYTHSDVERITRSSNGGETLQDMKEEIMEYINNMEENCPNEEWSENWNKFKEKRDFLQEKGVGEFCLRYYYEPVKRYYGEGISPDQLEIEIRNSINWFIRKYKDEIDPIQLPNCIRENLNPISNYINFIGDF
jgi:predicted transcriptional regulator